MQLRMKNWKTTATSIFTAFFGFVMLHPHYFPGWMEDVAGYAAVGGLRLFRVPDGAAALYSSTSLVPLRWNDDESGWHVPQAKTYAADVDWFCVPL